MFQVKPQAEGDEQPEGEPEPPEAGADIAAPLALGSEDLLIFAEELNDESA